MNRSCGRLFLYAGWRMGGVVVLAIIAVIGIVALVLAGSAMDKNKTSRPHRRMEKTKAHHSTRGRSSPTKAGVQVDAEDLLTELNGLPLIPPPDEKRIEGISPKNDVPKFTRGGM